MSSSAIIRANVVVLAVDVAESKKKVLEYLKEHPRKCRIVLTGDTNLAAMYAANSYPIYVVVDREGKIVDTQRGAGGERSLRRMLEGAGMIFLGIERRANDITGSPPRVAAAGRYPPAATIWR